MPQVAPGTGGNEPDSEASHVISERSALMPDKRLELLVPLPRFGVFAGMMSAIVSLVEGITSRVWERRGAGAR